MYERLIKINNYIDSINSSLEESYFITVRAEPISNRKADFYPERVLWKIECAGNTFTMINENYPSIYKISWRPKVCDRSEIIVNISKTTCSKAYYGNIAVSKLIKKIKERREIALPDCNGETISLDFGFDLVVEEKMNSIMQTMDHHLPEHLPLTDLKLMSRI